MRESKSLALPLGYTLLFVLYKGTMIICNPQTALNALYEGDVLGEEGLLPLPTFTLYHIIVTLSSVLPYIFLF